MASLIAILLSLRVGGFAATAIVLVPAILSILQITKGVWTPEGGGKSAIGVASLGVALLAVSTNKTWRPIMDSLLDPLFSKYPGFKDRLPIDSPSIFSLLFLGAVILIVNFTARDKTAMKEHPTPVDKEFPEREYKALLRAFCRILRNDLDRIDHETNWSTETFTPLDAEVEIQSGNRRIKKVTDLLSAIKSDKTSRVFLVLGDPGSGKSVSLRKLCRDLLDEVESSGKVPIYVNLREWERKEIWTEQNPLRVEELYDFVLENLRDRGDVFTRDFLTKYYRHMFENGRLFIVLDSFDEIPAVLDVDENSWLIHELSEVIYKFLSGAHESRGILASRIFRRPTTAFNARTVLVLRPFTELKIVDMLKKSLFYDDSLIKLLFNYRQEFIPIARNPFTAALISSYVKEHGNTLPTTQSELYSSYIDHRLQLCQEKIEAKRLTSEFVVGCAIDIAHVMFASKSLGLEASIQQLQHSLPNQPIADVVDILRYARLARLGPGDASRFSFAHRRFNEYFVVKRIKENSDQAPLTDIPTDSRWRDALVLYAEVADEERAEQIAVFCWNEIEQLSNRSLKMNDPRYLRAVHCLRFLKDAFRARLTAINSFRADLGMLINNELSEGENLVSQKIAVEAVGLVHPEDMEHILGSALAHRSHWINEVALRSCHYLSDASIELKRQLRSYIDRLGLFSFMRRRRELILWLTLSNVFSDVRWHCHWRLFDTAILVLAILLWSTFVATLGGIPLIVLIVCAWIESRVEKAFLFSVVGTMAISFYFLVVALLIVISEPRPPARIPFYITCIVFLASIPWYRASHQFLFEKRQEAGRRTSLISMSVSVFVVVSLVVLVIPFYITVWVSLSGWAIGGSLSIILLLRYLIKLGKDVRLLTHLSISHLSTREAIAIQMSRMRTDSGRLRLVRFLDLQAKEPAGEWPNGTMPNFDDDRASTLLAQLEEKWLGIDR